MPQPLAREERENANKYMLLGVRFTLKLLGVDRDALLARFIEQEFQAWVQSVEGPMQAPVGSRAKAPARARTTRKPSHPAPRAGKRRARGAPRTPER